MTELLLKKIIEIQEITLRETARGVTQAHVYREYIKDVYFVSKSTYDRYLCLNAKSHLAKLEERKEREQ
ncbi:MAG: hypothetical protein ACK5L5_12330 [Bacteroidales bacterium]